MSFKKVTSKTSNVTGEKPRPKLHPKMEAKQFKPGQSGNPKGRPPLNPIQRALKEFTLQTYAEVIEAVLVGNMDNLQRIINDPKTPAIQVGVARAFYEAMKKGDYSVMERIAERIVGKIPDKIDINTNNKSQVQVDQPIDKDRLMQALKEIQEDV